MYLLKISITHNEKRIPLLNLVINCISARSQILIQKLEHYGINEKILSWFENYLTNQKQYIQYDSNNNNNTIMVLTITTTIIIIMKL